MTKIISAVWREMSSQLSYVAKEAFKKLPGVLIFLSPFFATFLTIEFYHTYQQWTYDVYLLPLACCCLTFITQAFRSVFVYERYGIPLARKRFTKRGERGEVLFSSADVIEMAEYIATVEEYCERKGLYRALKSVVILLAFGSLLSLITPTTCRAEEVSFCISSQEESVSFFENLTEEEVYLLQQIALAEAENQGTYGMLCVMEVIINRTLSDDFPDTITEVITQNNQFASYQNGSYLTKVPNTCSACAYSLLCLTFTSSNKGALYFENPQGRTDTWHSRNLQYVFTYRDHVFYK